MRPAPSLALLAALACGVTLPAAAADSPAFGPLAGTASASYHTTWSTPNAYLTNAPLTLDETVTANRSDDGSVRLLVGDKLLGTLDADGYVKRGGDVGTLGNLRDAFAHLAGLMRGHPASLADGAAWKGNYTVRAHGANYDVPLAISASVRGDTLHVTAQGQGSGALVERSGDSTILESADYVGGVLQKASGHELTLERGGGRNTNGNATVDITWSVEAK